MSSPARLIDIFRRSVNRLLKVDIVRVSGQYKLEAHIGTVMEAYGVDGIIDVGANEGAFGALMRGIGYRGPIYSFEPVASAFAVLSRRAASDRNWHVFDFALGAEEGKAQINVSRFTQFSSILSATSYGNSWENMKVEHKQDIVIRRLDNCFQEGLLGAGKRYFLKMDTQGFDLEVFNGAAGFLPKICCMLSEVSLIAIYEGMPSYIESLARYNSEGFLVSGLYPITRHRNLALNEMDCMLVQPRFLNDQAVSKVEVS